MVDNKRALRRTAQPRCAVDLSDVLADLLAATTRVASFVPLPTEPGVPPRHGWLLPVLRSDRDLDWAVYEGQLSVGRVREPVGPRLGVEAIATCDLVLVPALLVDWSGNRLGKGGGSYDRALRRATGLTVALLSDAEFVESLPTESHDVPVRAVATPSLGIVYLPRKM